MKKTTQKKGTKPPGEGGENPTQEQMREAAYYRWLERGSPSGEELEDWLAVEDKWRDNIVPSRND